MREFLAVGGGVDRVAEGGEEFDEAVEFFVAVFLGAFYAADGLDLCFGGTAADGDGFYGPLVAH